MKQLTCEMCGSTNLIKQDGVFACQTCGCKYSVEEAKKMMIEGNVDVSGSTVFIDNTKQVESNLKRAKQYETQGNNYFAMEYYNKALDLDADNIEANNGVARLRAKNKWSDYYVIEPEISPQENVNRFLNELSEAKNIACDIYANIKIKSIKEKYYDFSFLKASGSVTWTATRCDQHIENETVYKTKYENGKQVQVPETNKVTRVERTPISGSKNWNCEKLFFVSNAIISLLNSEDDCFAKEINNEFVELQDELYGKYKPVRLNPDKISEKNGISKYDGLQIEVTTDLSRQSKISDDLIDSEISRCCNGTLNSTETTYYENIDAKSNTSSKTIAKILLPVQVIVYEYKGKEYSAISSLSNKCQIIQTIPTDTELYNSQKDISETCDKLTKRKYKDAPKILFATAALMPIISAIICFIDGNDFEPYPYVTFPLMGIVVVLAFIFLFVDLSNKKAIEKAIDAKSVEYKMLLKPRTSLLQSTKSKFFEKYSDVSSVESASEYAKINDSMMSNIEVLRTIVDVNYMNIEKSDNLNADDENLAADKKLSEIKSLAFTNKIQAIIAYSELCNVPLAEAEKAVEKMINQ